MRHKILHVTGVMEIPGIIIMDEMTEIKGAYRQHKTRVYMCLCAITKSFIHSYRSDSSPKRPQHSRGLSSILLYRRHALSEKGKSSNIFDDINTDRHPAIRYVFCFLFCTDHCFDLFRIFCCNLLPPTSEGFTLCCKYDIKPLNPLIYCRILQSAFHTADYFRKFKIQSPLIHPSPTANLLLI